MNMFEIAEAKKMLEFCIELNNQDDRANFPQDVQYKADLSGWSIAYDSRDANDSNPETNGFGPFNNAWLLLQSQSDSRQWAIALRGTVGETRSIIDDFLATSITAYAGIEYPSKRYLPLVFANTPKAEIHMGFAYAAFTMLLDKDKGILKQLQAVRASGQLPDDADIFITGHSQGAAVATLIYSFLHYALADSSDRYQLALRLRQDGGAVGVQLKSYFFAQPKPGNLQYAMDFARITSQQGLAYVINNSLDPVPQVPLSIQTPADVADDVIEENKHKGGFFSRLALDGLDSLFDGIVHLRSRISNRAESITSKTLIEHWGHGGNAADHLDIDQYFRADESVEPTQASSLNYALAGQLIPVFGLDKGGDLYPLTGDKPDFLLQHHATTYRILLDRQLA